MRLAPSTHRLMAMAIINLTIIDKLCIVCEFPSASRIIYKLSLHLVVLVKRLKNVFRKIVGWFYNNYRTVMRTVRRRINQSGAWMTRQIKSI